MSAPLAVVTLLQGDDGLEVKFESALSDAELGAALGMVADQLTEQAESRPRNAGCWGAPQPERDDRE